MLTLGIETSCDETAAAVVEDGNRVLSSAVYSQIKEHRAFGGVVPEIASRNHIIKIIPIIRAALQDGSCTLPDIDVVAVTNRPGLIGSLLVGVSAAKSIAYALQKPLVGINHIEAHFYSCFLTYPEITFPCVGLIISGGHTHLFCCQQKGDFKFLGQTRDDAAGESYDKVAKMLGLGYPGGPVIDKKATGGDPAYTRFPRAYLEEDSLDFSFSGLKTAVLVFLQEKGEREVPGHIDDICACFQDAVTEVLVEKTIRAAHQQKVKDIIVAGGVACNRSLKQRFQQRAAEEGLRVFIPPAGLCTDNAVMVAANGYDKHLRAEHDGLDLEATPFVEYAP